MISKILVLLLVSLVAGQRSCYWNRECSYQLFSSKTPYETIRGDIRDYPDPQNCQAISVWSLNRHGNRNPGNSVTENMKAISELKDEIIASYQAGRSQLCAQDIEDFRTWTWNSTLEVSQSFLTGTGYEELYDIAKRLRHRYPHLLRGSNDSYYFRRTNEQRTITSAVAFVHGLTDGTSLDLPIDGPYERDDVIRPYENCDRYQEQVKGAPVIDEQVNAYYSTSEFIAVQNGIQQRLGITTQLSPDNIYALYEICRFYRSWTEKLQSPWCSVFTDQDLVVLEYRDDVRHYHRNGYGSWVNERLGGPVLKDLYENFEAVLEGRGRNVVAYFTHDTMLEMAYCAMGLFKDDSPILGARRDPNTLWRTSDIGAFSANIMAVLNRCEESGNLTHRVQIFINEKETTLCPFEGCTWEEFQEKFQGFKEANLDFCSLNFREPALTDSGDITKSVMSLVMMMLSLVLMTE